MKDERLTEMRQDYETIPIPEELEERVTTAIRWGKKGAVKLPERSGRTLYGIALHIASAAATILLLITIIANSNETVAYAMESIPFLGAVARVVTFREYTHSQHHMQADVKVPTVSVENQEGVPLEKSTTDLNRQIEEYTSQIITAYEQDAKVSGEEGHMELNLDYEIVTDSDRVFALRFDQRMVMAGTMHSVQIYNLDKTTGDLLSLGDLFQEGCDYITPISDYLKEEMHAQMEADENISYFYETDYPELNFTTIRPNENFYISQEGRLVLVFDKYEIAPGYMGSVEFEIPTEVIADIVKDGFLKGN